jgi:lipoate-protein ligase A
MSPRGQLFTALCEVLSPEPSQGPWQMAADEVLLHRCAQPTLRIYRWAEPQVTFGFFGVWKGIAEKFPELRLTRRWTGGGVVEHGTDFTWSLCLPAQHELARLRGADFYRVLHEAVVEVLRQAGAVDAMLAPAGAGDDLCFARPVAHDVVDGSEKIAGGALRRTRAGVLYQGSIRVDADADKELRKRFCGALAQTQSAREFSPQELALIEQLVERRYGNPLWLRERRDGNLAGHG